MEARENQEHQEVGEEAQHQDEPEDHGRRGVTGPAQRPAGGGRVRHGARSGAADVVAMLQEGHHGNLVIHEEDGQVEVSLQKKKKNKGVKGVRGVSSATI